ncbi:hypothetical protein FACS189445_0970 [Spirochaetia bacterium]|nr:hypothetical protein FACS189445_0970 [Spirochaetia bacterium]
MRYHTLGAPGPSGRHMLVFAHWRTLFVLSLIQGTIPAARQGIVVCYTKGGLPKQAALSPLFQYVGIRHFAIAPNRDKPSAAVGYAKDVAGAKCVV